MQELIPRRASFQSVLQKRCSLQERAVTLRASQLGHHQLPPLCKAATAFSRHGKQHWPSLAGNQNESLVHEKLSSSLAKTGRCLLVFMACAPSAHDWMVQQSNHLPHSSQLHVSSSAHCAHARFLASRAAVVDDMGASIATKEAGRSVAILRPHCLTTLSAGRCTSGSSDFY